jgi:hypothetical protein
MGSSDDEVPYLPSWLLPDALEQLLSEFDDAAGSSIRSSWAALSSTQRHQFWVELTEPRQHQARLKRALLIAETLLETGASGGIPGQARPSD